MTIPMYRISSLNTYWDGMCFDSLAKAKAAADKVADRGTLCDVIAFTDKNTFRVVYSANSGHLPAIRGTYRKDEEQ